MNVASAFFVTALGLLSGFQLALAAGLPWGRFAWGGQHAVLPRRLRISSLAAVLLYALIGVFALSRAGIITVIQHQPTTVIGMWLIAIYLCLSILPNAISRSKPERYLMTPVSALLAVLALLIARG